MALDLAREYNMTQQQKGKKGKTEKSPGETPTSSLLLRRIQYCIYVEGVMTWKSPRFPMDGLFPRTDGQTGKKENGKKFSSPS